MVCNSGGHCVYSRTQIFTRRHWRSGSKPDPLLLGYDFHPLELVGVPFTCCCTSTFGWVPSESISSASGGIKVINPTQKNTFKLNSDIILYRGFQYQNPIFADYGKYIRRFHDILFQSWWYVRKSCAAIFWCPVNAWLRLHPLQRKF